MEEKGRRRERKHRTNLHRPVDLPVVLLLGSDVVGLVAFGLEKSEALEVSYAREKGNMRRERERGTEGEDARERREGICSLGQEFFVLGLVGSPWRTDRKYV